MSPRRPASRRKVLLAALFAAGIIAAIVAGTEALRYPHPTTAAVTAPDPAETEMATDFRDPIECPDPLPREGQERETGDLVVLTLRTSNELYDCPQFYDGQQIRYRGEVVGAVLRRTNGAWVHLNDDIYADIGPLPAHRDYRGGNAGLGVFVPHELADEILHVGGPRNRGDIVEVVGVFHRVDDRTGEVAVLRASEGTVRAGRALERPRLPARRIVAAVMTAVMLAVVTAERRQRRRATQ